MKQQKKNADKNVEKRSTMAERQEFSKAGHENLIRWISKCNIPVYKAEHSWKLLSGTYVWIRFNST